jgi:hypothetical protein
LHLFMDEWQNLKSTKPGIQNFDVIVSRLRSIIKSVKVVVINSTSQLDYSYNEGINIIIGGNTLGRGLTFQGLNTVYYCRIAKTPQADTCWQHSRIFGYDRDKDICRVFLPPSLLHLFRALNEANEAMIGVLKEKGFDAVSILSLPNTRPTRKSVVKSQNQFIIIGGVNYFPFNPISSNLDKLDDICGTKNTDKVLTLKEGRKILDLTEVDNDDSFPKDIMIKAIDALSRSNYKQDCRLIVRTDRDVSKGTGTLLSPDDRQLCSSLKDQLVLVLYRLNGTREKGWQGKPLWVPNIKFPEGKNYYSVV